MFTNRVVQAVLFACAAGAIAVGDARAESTSPSRWVEGLSFFGGLDGSKQPQDLGINANMGARFAADWGIPVWEKVGLGMHLGTAVNVSDAAVHVLDQIEGTSSRTQYFVSTGFFQRDANRFTWSLGYDFQYQSYYDDFQLGQWRGMAGYDVTRTNQFGAWFSIAQSGESGYVGTTQVHLDPITQANAYWMHSWPSAARTTLWAGVASGHDNVVLVIPNDSEYHEVFVYGADLHLPLSDRFAITGAANFLTPTSTGTVDAHLGIAFFPGRTVLRHDISRFSPPTTVANNATFSVNLER